MDKLFEIISEKSFGCKTCKIINILGEEYKVFNYDTFIFDALTIVNRWTFNEGKLNPKVTMSFIINLRYWIKENINHSHYIPYKNIRSYSGVKKFINSVVEAEFIINEGDSEDYIYTKKQAIQVNLIK